MNTGDLVWYDTLPAVITGITGPDHDPTYHLHTIPGGAITAAAEHLRPAGPRPEPGQRWQCISRPDLVLTVYAVQHGGMVAECETSTGKDVGTVILAGRYRLIGAVQ